jgi:hypothetical protein
LILFSNDLIPKAMTRKKQSENEIVVFSIIRNSKCSECGTELWQGDLLKKEGDRVLCLTCADLDHLVYLPRGDATLTRRASKYSSLQAVIVQFSRTRKRYERQGILVEEAALKKAEEECLSDVELRAHRRERDAERRKRLDIEYLEEFARQIYDRYPSCPQEEATAIAGHACRKHSGRVGRSAAAKEFNSKAIDLAIVAHIRHNYTNYDELLILGWSRQEARNKITSEVQKMLKCWQRSTRKLLLDEVTQPNSKL